MCALGDRGTPLSFHFCYSTSKTEPHLAAGLGRVHSSDLQLWPKMLRILHVIPTPFPVSEAVLCSSVVTSARLGLAPGTIWTYLAGVRHAQIMKDPPEPHQHPVFTWCRVESGGTRQRGDFPQHMPACPSPYQACTR